MKTRSDPNRRGATTPRMLALSLALLAGAAGCEDTYRLNHFHSDSNQKLADQSFESFEAFTSQTGGLTPQLLRNVEARKTVETAVGDARSRVHDTDMATLTTEMTWERLRLELFTQLGLVVGTDHLGNQRALNLSNPDDYAQALRIVSDADTPAGQRYTYDQRLRDRIEIRQVKVTAVAKVYKMLGDAHRVLAAEAGKRFKRTADELAALKDPAAGPDPAATTAADQKEDQRVQWVRKFFKAILDTRDLYQRDREAARASNELQRKLLAEIERSRDPEEALALVPIVGAGLSDGDFVLLDAYLRKLQVEFECLKSELPAGDAPTAPANEADASWAAVLEGLGDSQKFIELALSLLDDKLDLDPTFAGRGPRAAQVVPKSRDAYVKSTKDYLAKEWDAKQAKVRAVSGTPSAKEIAAQRPAQRLADLRTVKPQVQAYKKEPGATVKAKRGPDGELPSQPYLDRAAQILRETTRDRAEVAGDQYIAQRVVLARALENRELEVTINAISRTRDGIGGSSAKIRAAAAQAPRPAAQLAKLVAQRVPRAAAPKTAAAAANPAVSPKPAGPDAAKGAEFLNKFLGLDVKLAGALDEAVKGGSLDESQLKYLGGVVDDIQQGAVDKHRRLLTFFSDLYDAQADLGQENARHTDVMLTVANIEFRRWVLLGILNRNYDEVYRGLAVPPPPVAVAQPSAIPLFAPDPLIKEWESAHPLVAAPANPRAHQLVAVTDPIWITIRKLAQTCKQQHDSQQSTDPDGFNLSTANERLYKAVRTVDGHLLMLSLNQHVSEENATRLRGELGAHGVQIDSLKARVQEAEYRLTLGDLKAFHASGVTQQDLQVIASGLLAWIGIGVN